MATSHYCNGKWRDGPIAACPRHEKLSMTQATVHRGVGEPGGRDGTKSADSGESKPSEQKSEKSSPKPSASSGSSSKEA